MHGQEGWPRLAPVLNHWPMRAHPDHQSREHLFHFHRVQGATCSGATLPLFRSMRGPYIGAAYNRPVFYSTYGMPNVRYQDL